MRRFTALGLIGWLVGVSAPARASVPNTFTVQGVLRDGQGNLQTMPISLSVAFLNASASGTVLAQSPVYHNVPVVNGLFTQVISVDKDLMPGALQNLSNAQEVWLEVTTNMGTATQETYTPQRVTSSIFALACATADVANGLATTVTLDAGKITGVLPLANGGTGIKTPGAAGSFLRSDGASWVSSRISAADVPRPVYTNPTTGKVFSLDAGYCGSTAPTTGAFTSGNLTGYAASKALCEMACNNSPKAHMCTGPELFRYLSTGGVLPDAGWYSSMTWVYQTTAISPGTINDCSGWTTSDHSTDGPGWYKGHPDFGYCDTPSAILCCD
jgi:hypothetical protein